MNLLKIRNVKSPSRGTPKSAGIDFYVPALCDDFLWDLFQKNKKLFYEKLLKEYDISLFEKFMELTLSKDELKVKSSVAILNRMIGTDFNSNATFTLPPHMDILIPSGIKTKFSEAAFIAFNKSGVATKQKLLVGAAVDDEDYQGELHIHVTNFSDEPQKIVFDNKITQFIIIPVRYDIPEIKENMSSEEFFGTVTDRGEGGFGSTSLK